VDPTFVVDPDRDLLQDPLVPHLSFMDASWTNQSFPAFWETLIPSSSSGGAACQGVVADDAWQVVHSVRSMSSRLKAAIRELGLLGSDEEVVADITVHAGNGSNL